MERTWVTPIQRGDDVTDPELKAYLDGMRQDLTQQIAESRLHAEQLNQDTRRDLMAHSEQLNQDTRRDLTAHAEQLNQDTRRDLMAHAEQLNRETGVLIEDVRHQVQLVAEGVITFNEKLDRFHDEVEAKILGLDSRVMRLEAQRRSSSDA
ncbi:MAG: hypothetical protein M0Z36_10515 [Thermaerobacter sp.]|nr:hypothetical protein [Thermaerobacter sp.]